MKQIKSIKSKSGPVDDVLFMRNIIKQIDDNDITTWPVYLRWQQTEEQAARNLEHAKQRQRIKRVRNLLRSFNGSLHNFGGFIIP